MGLMTWLGNTIAMRSIDRLVQTGLDNYQTEYNHKIGRFYFPKKKHQKIGFAIYNRISRYPGKISYDTIEISKDIILFLNRFYDFLKKNKNHIPNQKQNFLKFVYISYISWNCLVKQEIKEQEEEQDALESTEADNKIKKLELKRQTQLRTKPTKQLQPAQIQALERALRNHGYRTNLSKKTIAECKKRNLDHFIKKSFHSMQKP